MNKPLRTSNPLEVTEVLPISEAELDGIIARGGENQAGKGTGSASITIERMRASHHAVARLVAQNLPDAEIALLTGYSTQRVATLKLSPGFQELTTYFTANKSDQDIELVDRMKALGLDVLEVIHEKVLTEPEKARLDDLTKLATGLLDRLGHGPTARVESVNLNAQVSIEEIRAKLGRGVTLRQQAFSGNSRPALGAPVTAEVSGGAGVGEPQNGEEQGAPVRADGGQGAEADVPTSAGEPVVPLLRPDCEPDAEVL